MPSLSASICASIVWLPEPISTTPVLRLTLPSVLKVTTAPETALVGGLAAFHRQAAPIARTTPGLTGVTAPFHPASALILSRHWGRSPVELRVQGICEGVRSPGRIALISRSSIGSMDSRRARSSSARSIENV